MPSRKEVFCQNGIFHIYNKTIDHLNIFEHQKINQRFLSLLHYYRSCKSIIRFSDYERLPSLLKDAKKKEISTPSDFKVNILSFCLMPNHFHLLIKQTKENGIIRFVSDIVNSITKYKNILDNRKGPIFLPQFKSRHIVSKEQLIHVSRYIHLNPFSSGLVDNLNDLKKYRWSSLSEYIGTENICNTNIILKEFNMSKDRYLKFVFSNADYQKSLEAIKHIKNW